MQYGAICTLLLAVSLPKSAEESARSDLGMKSRGKVVRLSAICFPRVWRAVSGDDIVLGPGLTGVDRLQAGVCLASASHTPCERV